MIRNIGFLLLVLLASCHVPKQLAKKAIKEHILDEEVHAQNFTGFMLYDVQKGETLFEQNGHHYFTPASNTKLYTLYTALSVLPDRLPALRYAIRNDTLYIMGTGDPSLLHPDLPDNHVHEWLKTASDSLQLVYIPDQFQGKHFGAGWAWDDFQAMYSREKSPLPIHGNFVRVLKQGSSFQANPQRFQRAIHIGDLVQKKGLIRVHANNNAYSYNPAFLPDTCTLDAPQYTNTYTTIKLLEDIINGHDKETRHERKIIEQNLHLIEGELDWRTLYGLPRDSVLIPFMLESDNFFAEQLMLMASGILFQDTLEVARAIRYAKDSLLADLPDPPRWVDGSGLSRYNLFSPADNVYVLKKLWHMREQKQLLKYFPAGGISGTIKNYYAGENGKPFIFAKTGTLSNNHCLSGYMQAKSGRWYIFSFMHNHYMGGSSKMKVSMDKVLRGLYEKL